MEYANYAITLDVQAAGSGVLLEARQGDTGRRIAITLTDGGRPYRLTEDCYCVFTGLKPDGHTVIHACQTVGSTVFYTLREQTLAASGRVKCELRIYGGEGMLLTSAAFGLLVEGTVYTRAENIESEDEYTALSDLLEKAQTLRQQLLELKTQLEALGDRLENGESGGGGGGGGAPGKDGKDGATFTPSVDVSGNLSWSNDGGLPNPATVNIKGEKGDPGEKGDQGEPGADGKPGEPGADGATVQEVLEEMPTVTAMNFSNFENGSFTETVDGSAVSHSVTFDDMGRPTKIDDIAVTWEG